MFSFTFTVEQVQTILAALDSQPHAQVRQLIDLIIGEANAQQQRINQQNAQKQEGGAQ